MEGCIFLGGAAYDKVGLIIKSMGLLIGLIDIGCCYLGNYSLARMFTSFQFVFLGKALIRLLFYNGLGCRIPTS